MRAHRCADRTRSRRTAALLVAGCVFPTLFGVAPAEAQDAPRVAVVPFRVHSSKPLDYLGESLATLVRSRLEATGRVQVVGASQVQALLRASPVDETSAAAVRALAGELRADYVVTGSVTELAGLYSLDVRLTPASPGNAGHTEVLTAERDEELLERINELTDRLANEMVGAARSTVASIEISGVELLERAYRGRMQTRVGEPYDPELLRNDLALLRSDPRVAQADVETESTEEGVVIRFRAVPAERIFRAAPGAEGEDRIAEVRVRGNRRIEAGAIRARIRTQAGDRYSDAGIAADVREIHALGFFRDVRVYREAGPEGLLVTFEVEENPVVRQISIAGNDSVEGDKIRDILTLTTGSTLDYPLLFENTERIEALYRAEGYYLAEVGYQIEPLGVASVGIHFEVTENEKLRLREIRFVGNERFTSDELTEGFQTKRWRLWSYATSWFDRSGTYSEPLFLQDLRGVEKKYTDAGYLQVDIGEPEVIPSPEGLVVSVEIREGRLFRVGQIDVVGDSTVDIEGLREKLKLETGEIFNRSYLTEDVASLTQYYTDRGFYFAQVTPRSNLTETSEVVDVAFQVRKGPLYFIRHIDVGGNTVTVDRVIRREIPVVEGQLYSQRGILLARGRLQRLGFFEEVDLSVEPTERPDELDLKISVVERPTGSFSFGAGFSSQDAIVVTGSLAQDNLFGRGYAVRLSADLGRRSQRFFLSFNDPYFLDSTFSLGTTLFRQQIRFEDFEQEQTGIDFLLGHSLSEDNRSRGFLRYSFASRKVLENINVNAAAVIFREILEDSITSSLLGLSFATDKRDDRIAPTGGYQLGASAEFAGLGFFSRFMRLEARAAWFLGAPRWLFDRSTFVLSSRMGYALPFNDISDFESPQPLPGEPLPDGFDVAGTGPIRTLDQIDTDIELPLSERYFLGGLGQFQLRGFKARSVGPRRPILTNTGFQTGALFRPLGTSELTGACTRVGPDGEVDPKLCNEVGQTEKDANVLDETDVIGGNKFISSSVEYRFPISDTLGLQGVFFLDFGNAFAEGDNLFAVDDWRYGTGGGVQWFSPFGPLAVVLGFPLDRTEVEKSPVFEFSVGGAGF